MQAPPQSVPPLPDGLTLSIHIPKTGGSTFGGVLREFYPGQVAFYYGADSPITHEMLRAKDAVYQPGMLDRLQDAGVRILHGHGSVRRFIGAAPDSARYWTWVREPAERLISAYYYMQKRAGRGRLRPERAALATELSLEDFAASLFDNKQSRLLAPFPIEAFGFVGVTERFDESLRLLGLPAPQTTANVNPARPAVAEDIKARLRLRNSEDVALHEAAIALLDRRLGAIKP